MATIPSGPRLTTRETTARDATEEWHRRARRDGLTRVLRASRPTAPESRP